MGTVESIASPVNGSAPAPTGRPPIAVENPATGQIISEVPDLGPDEVVALVARARAAQPGWEAMGFSGRARVMQRMQRWVVDHADEFVETIVSETGKTHEDATVAELMYAGNAFKFWAKEAEGYLAPRKFKPQSPLLLGRKLKVRYAPLGVVGVIGPWNYPFNNSVGDCIPALMAGNAVVLKPSEVTPLTSLLMERAFVECGLPADVLLVATGRGDTGAALIDEVDMIMFTGSAATGKKVMQRAAETLIPVALELGGKDAMIVLEDANVERAANTALFYGMLNGGQTCISIERVYVVESVYDEFVAKVTEKARELRQGDPSGGPGSVEVGAVTFDKQIDIVESHVNDALAKGARAVVGGRRGTGPGRFFEPTVLVDVDHSMDAMTEETFGPTLPIMKVADVEEAIRLVNDSPYGLSASVFTADTVRGEQIARRIEAGAVCVNDALVNYLAMNLPMGGWKSSGIGSRHGADGIKKFTHPQALVINAHPLTKELQMYPNRKLKAKVLMVVAKVMLRRRVR